MINSKKKGSTFERQIVKKFTEWVGIPFKRNWGTEKQYIGILRGDIIPYYSNPNEVEEHPLTLIIECKNQESWELEDLILNSAVSGILKWWNQTEKEAVGTLAYPLLIIKKRYHLSLCIYPLKLHSDYFHNSNTPNGSLLWNSLDSDKKIITPLYNFFSTYEYEKIEKLVKEKIKENK